MKKQVKDGGGIRRLNPRQSGKAELDLQTPYITLLPHMEDGFHTGYQSKPGIVSDTNSKPHEWLENVAKYMQTQGEDVGYSIPDVLAGEQQMRRLIRLPHEEAIRHQEMINWRATLALLLLWDNWEKDETWPLIAFEDFLAEESLQNARMFQRAVSAALTQERAKEGLKVFTISSQRDQKPDKRPLCLLSRSVIVMPAANPGDLSEILPRQVRWYDRKRVRFLDPCAWLEERDRTRLLLQLRLLQFMNEKKELESALYSSDAQLVSPLERFIDDLQSFREAWRDKLEQRDEIAVRELYIRVLAVYGLADPASGMEIRGLSEEHRQTGPSSLTLNPLISCLMLPGKALTTALSTALPPGLLVDVSETEYLLDGIPFAKAAPNGLLEPTNHPGEAGAMKRLTQETALLNDFSGEWNTHMAKKLDELYEQLRTRVGISAVALSLLKGWQAKHAAFPMQGDRGITLYYPIEGHPQTLNLLLSDLLGMTDADAIGEAFSDSLLLIPDTGRPPFDDLEICEACRVEGGHGVPDAYAIPPLSPWLAAWLMDQSEGDDPYTARLLPKSLSFTRDAETGAVRASFRIACRRQGKDAMLTNSVTFCKTYTAKKGAGGLTVLSENQLPFVVSWPNVRLAANLWKQYFVYAHRPGPVDVWVRREAIWVQGTLRRATDVNVKGQVRQRVWQTASTQRYPSYVVLKRGALTLGVLFNDAPREMLKHEPAAVVAIDFGSISTTVMLRQGDKVLSALLPKCLHTCLLRAKEGDEQFLTDELLPTHVLLSNREHESEQGSTFYSVMDMFTDDRQNWRHVLRDGHIYYRESLAALMQKSESALYYDMKWNDEDYVLQCMRLFLKQVMTQASLSARLCGAPTVSWRISMPNALPLPRQEAYLEMTRGLSQEVAQETGLPLTERLPSVLFATENQADGLYFRERNEVNVRSGYINMDIGGATTDISVWLNHAQKATFEASFLLGCRQMLFDSIFTRHLDLFEQDFVRSSESVRAVVRSIAGKLGAGVNSARARQKSMFLLDDFFARYNREIWKMMAEVRGEGRISYVESLLLLNIGFLFHVCGEMLNRVWMEPETRRHLHRRMEICIAGNGGQLLKAFDSDTRERLCRLTLQALEADHPVRELLLIQSRHPKQEVAMGLLSDEQSLRSTIQVDDGWRSGHDMPVDHERPRQMIRSFPVRFYAAFPQAAETLLPGVFNQRQSAKGVILTPAAAMELETILDNEFSTNVMDDFTAYARCFAAMKRLWSR